MSLKLNLQPKKLYKWHWDRKKRSEMKPELSESGAAETALQVADSSDCVQLETSSSAYHAGDL